ncbi:MAG: hypothetical protein LBL94_05820 [Prevotellaceae bacterium]|jgi:hypothetical protein|nr:hypothetical protein [Prevotellaceae bacterium]
MEAIALEAQKAELARKVLNLSDERIVNRLTAFFTQATVSAKEGQSPLYHESFKLKGTLLLLKNITN